MDRIEEAPGPSAPQTPPEFLAAVDLGSNSFHMLIVHLLGGEPVVVDRLREQVQLAEGLGPDGHLGEEAMERALACLARFGQRLREMPGPHVRAVGTNTLRSARNGRRFLVEAERALGQPIEILSGREEGRLIYLGAAHTLPNLPGKRLVIDIGGGSTECILGERFETQRVDSLYMGCVSYSKCFFTDGSIREENLEDAILAARAELQTIERELRASGWRRAFGCSGTVRAVEEIMRAQGWTQGGITAKGLRKLRKHMLAAGRVGALELSALKPERAPVLPGGVAILLALFQSLGLDELCSAAGALREGVVYDLLGRFKNEDVRERTIALFQQRYQVDLAQAGRVERTARALLRQVVARWRVDAYEAEKVLAWAAQLHEIGLTISYTHYHRHGAYILAHADMPGFSRDDQQLLAALVRAQRRKLSRRIFAELPGKRAELALRLAMLLRLAVLLNRGRSPESLAEPALIATGEHLELAFPPGWIAEHPLTRRDLQSEVHALRNLGVELRIGASQD